MEAAAARRPNAEPLADPGGSDGRSVSIAELRPGQQVEGRFAVVRKDRMTARNGAPYVALELRDRSGKIAAHAFRDADRIAARFERGDAIAARGKAERFRGELRLELTDARPLAEGSYDAAEFLPAAYRSVEELEGFLEHLTREIHHVGLRGVVERVWRTEPLASELRRAPCTRRGHHAYLGGLLEHTVSVGTLAGELCQLHPRLNSDLLMAAALVHDAGRAREFTFGAEFGVTEEGRMLGHLALGAEIVGSAATDLDEELRIALIHCVLCHHGPEAGPGRSRAAGRGDAMSPEAVALQRVNALDAGVKSALE